MTFDDKDNSIIMESFEQEAISIEDGDVPSNLKVNPFKIILWGMVSTLCILLIGFFTIFRGQIEEQQFIAELESQGAEIRKALNPPDWMKSIIRDYPLMREWFLTIGSIKIDSIDMTQEQIERLSESPMLSSAVIKSDTLTREGLFALGEAPRLRTISLISCPKISKSDLNDFSLKFPNIVTSWRGNAFLGIRSYQTKEYHYISSIMENSPAERSGLKAHDRITAVNGDSVSSFDGLVNKLAEFNSGDVVKMSVLRGSEMLQIEVELGSWTNQI